MAVGQTYSVTSGTAQQYFIPSGFSANSLAVLNPNDGVCYIARNRNMSAPTNVGAWDYKVPSQSYALLPGPYQSAGVWYVDQSGSNRSGEITLYPVAEKYTIPTFQAIGRAVQVAGSVLDISQGNQPANPPLGTSRLWIDGNGVLNVAQPDGTNHVELDNTNYAPYVLGTVATAPLGGDLSGPINNGRVTAHTGPVALDQGVQLTFQDANHRIYEQSNTLYFDEYGTFVWRCSSRGYANTMQLDANGNLSPASSIFLGSNQWLFLGAGNTNGIISDNTNLYIRSNGVVDIQNTSGSPTTLNAGTLAASSVVSTANQFQWTADGSYSFVSGGYIYFRTGANGIVVQSTGGVATGVNCGSIVTNPGGGSFQGAVDCASWLRSQSGQLYLTSAGCRIDLGSGQMDYLGQNGGTNHRFFHQDGSWMGTQAANFQVQSDIRYKANVVEVSDDDCLTRLRTPGIPVITWTPDNPMPDSPSVRDIGFSAQAMASATPETVTVDSDGNYFLAYGQLTAVLWGALRATDATLQAVIAALPPGMRPPNVYNALTPTTAP